MQTGNEYYKVKDIIFKNVSVIFKGGVPSVPDEPAEFENRYPESNVFGILPASGYYIRHGENIRFENCTNVVSLPDARDIIYFSGEDSYFNLKCLNNLK